MPVYDDLPPTPTRAREEPTMLDQETMKRLQEQMKKASGLGPDTLKQLQEQMKRALAPVEVRSDVTLRIDTGLRARARELDINISRFLEATLRDEVERREMRAAAAVAGESEDIRLDLVDSEDRTYVGKFRGRLLGEAREVAVYLADDERVIVHDVDRRTYSEVDDLSELESWFPHDFDVYVDVMHALGETPEVEI
jgi:post-segregation antitoxin (ccd killing protein)